MLNIDFMSIVSSRRYLSAIYLGVVLNAIALFPATAQLELYNPQSISSDKEISDILTEKDIPTGEGGFARDYYVELQQGDHPRRHGLVYAP